MTTKSMIIAVALVVCSQLHAGNLLKLAGEPLVINNCPITQTQDATDLALSNKGYFVVANGEKNSELLFTRYGKLYVDQDHYLRTDDGNYLLGINKKSDSNHLKKIKVPSKNLAPKATTKVKIAYNLPANAVEGEEHKIHWTVYDSLSKSHALNVKSTKINASTWKLRVFVDDVECSEGTLVFNPTTGKLRQQKGLQHILWPTEYGMNELRVDFKTSTQYATHFELYRIEQNGYTMGKSIHAFISEHGEVRLFFTNGQVRTLKNRIAVAMFTNPESLESVDEHLRKPNTRSGQAMIHWLNSEYAVLSGVLEEKDCIAG